MRLILSKCPCFIGDASGFLLVGAGVVVTFGKAAVSTHKYPNTLRYLFETYLCYSSVSAQAVIVEKCPLAFMS